MINVTKTFLPPIEEYNAFVKRAFDKEWLTNRGELVQTLERELITFLGIENIIITNNGTVPIQMALRLLANQGEVITTPFSYVATTAAILWDRSTPVFVDIDSERLTIDENKIEAAITNNTKAILATHVFGNPCNVEIIKEIANNYKLSIIYDAAHCFGVKYKGESIFNYGDVSTCSFHATKLFHTGEGGAVFTNNKELNHKLFYSHNFGHDGPEKFHGLGINAKISELQAAMGLAVLPYMHEIIEARKVICDYYQENLNFQNLKSIKIREHTEWNYSYFPIIFENEKLMLKVKQMLNNNNIFPRRYFYPSLNRICYLEGENMPISESVASRILCLPLFVGLSKKNLKSICEIINREL
ncbi:DegT/DnrJ/EryC1/StrS family aminotransferase [uncultured Croceitalea sp.]|uniref:DegT/DnrJ/EryC1/StrS family aminotransferase n=1 Tax=uncultured Croceitalea sp. TaxID=1798908 RepID=UPI00374EBB5E